MVHVSKKEHDTAVNTFKHMRGTYAVWSCFSFTVVAFYAIKYVSFTCAHFLVYFTIWYLTLFGSAGKVWHFGAQTVNPIDVGKITVNKLKNRIRRDTKAIQVIFYRFTKNAPIDAGPRAKRAKRDHVHEILTTNTITFDRSTRSPGNFRKSI